MSSRMLVGEGCFSDTSQQHFDSVCSSGVYILETEVGVEGVIH